MKLLQPVRLLRRRAGGGDSVADFLCESARLRSASPRLCRHAARSIYTSTLRPQRLEGRTSKCGAPSARAASSTPRSPDDDLALPYRHRGVDIERPPRFYSAKMGVSTVRGLIGCYPQPFRAKSKARIANLRRESARRSYRPMADSCRTSSDRIV